jgi:hypothetical protein
MCGCQDTLNIVCESCGPGFILVRLFAELMMAHTRNWLKLDHATVGGIADAEFQRKRQEVVLTARD